MKNCTELDKFNLELSLQAILWYGTGYHSRETSIKIDLLKDIFEITTAEDLQKLYNLLGQSSARIHGVCFADGTVEMNPIHACPIYLLSRDFALTNRSIIYSFKDDLDDASIFVTEFFTDLREYFTRETLFLEQVYNTWK